MVITWHMMLLPIAQCAIGTGNHVTTVAETGNMPHHYMIYVCTKEGPIESKEVRSRVGNIRSLCHFILFIVSRTTFKECIN